MQGPEPTEMILIRHAPVAEPGLLAGRSDLPARLPEPRALGAARQMLAGWGADPGRLVVSPALRCRETAAALFPGTTPPADPRLWEQDFGAWDGRPMAAMPDLGPQDRAALATLRPPGGESFLDAAGRIAPALDAMTAAPGIVTLVVHAGTIRAALGQALGTPEAGLAFEIAPLSATRIRLFPDGSRGIAFVNRALT
ncbi:histidine phosphatase family protein [Acidimangrovimonas sediminis]|uniref:histidine phosphatase family protein n=1 Tax=Acidimangrovimonas sediminis TaxID=2056283 RepID=UPI000C800148|nr:histidine phosphatase family protein [Acidimangrovimonas sediminis]